MPSRKLTGLSTFFLRNTEILRKYKLNLNIDYFNWVAQATHATIGYKDMMRYGWSHINIMMLAHWRNFCCHTLNSILEGVPWLQKNQAYLVRYFSAVVIFFLELTGSHSCISPWYFKLKRQTFCLLLPSCDIYLNNIDTFVLLLIYLTKYLKPGLC